MKIKSVKITSGVLIFADEELLAKVYYSEKSDEFIDLIENAQKYKDMCETKEQKSDKTNKQDDFVKTFDAEQARNIVLSSCQNELHDILISGFYKLKKHTTTEQYMLSDSLVIKF